MLGNDVIDFDGDDDSLEYVGEVFDNDDSRQINFLESLLS